MSSEIKKLHPFHERHISYLRKIEEITLAKSHDYAGSKDPASNFRDAEKLGLEPWKGILIRIGDKYNRICNFAAQGELKVKDENIKDTLLDLANYALLCLGMYEDGQEKKIPEPT